MLTWVPHGATLPALLPRYDSCYVCGMANPVGLRISFFAHPGNEIRASLHPGESFAGYDGVVHGGVISAFLDELTGWAVSLDSGLLAVTAALEVRFVAPVLTGRRYQGSARLGEGRRRLWSAQGNLCDEEGRVCARATGKYFLLSSEQTADVALRLIWHDGRMCPEVPGFELDKKVGG